MTAKAIFLQAAATLPALFVPEELILAVWQRDPKRFGLRGHEDRHPDSKRVLCYLCGPRGLCGDKAYLERVIRNGQVRYRLTEIGRLFLEGKDSPTLRATPLILDLEASLWNTANQHEAVLRVMRRLMVDSETAKRWLEGMHK